MDSTEILSFTLTLPLSQQPLLTVTLPAAAAAAAAAMALDPPLDGHYASHECQFSRVSRVIKN